MKKNFIVFFSFIFLFLKPLISLAETTSDINYSIAPYCKNKINQDTLKKLDNLKINNIEVKLKNNKKWTVNSINILIGNFRWVPEKYKNRFDATVKVNFENDLECNFEARVRHNGDEKDHISLKDNSIIQSIDVHLKTGHIYGITKFKLLRPNTRGKLEDEIFLTELLRELNYIAPRTIYVSAIINGVNSKMIFQEKAAKELLEYHKRREGPIFEGDERFIFRLAENLPDTHLSNFAIGAMPLLEKGVNAGLAKQTNSKLIFKSKKHSDISFNSLSNLNLAYLLYTNMYKNGKNNFYYSGYNLDNNLLAFADSENILKLDIYNLLIFSTNAWHGLVPNNRKFYWNSIENYFEPINYDSNPNIESEQNAFHLPASTQIMLAFNKLEKLLLNLDINKLSQKLNFKGLEFNEEQVNNKITVIRRNLKNIKTKYSDIDPEILSYNSNNKIKKEMWDKYFNSLYEIDPSIYLIKHSAENNLFERCENGSFKCINYEFNDNQLSDLIEGELIQNDKEYQYLGKNVDSNSLLTNSKYKKVNFKDTYFYFGKNIKYTHDKEKKEFNIFQIKPGARAFFYQGVLKDINVNFYGFEDEAKFEPPNYPIDERGLTGCLSLIRLKVENININSNNSTCEDALNLLSVEGSIGKIEINNSFSDALDIDFSKIEIDDIKVFSAKNDCTDFSGGNYNLNKLNLINCGDKALSVGEKSFLTLNEIIVENSNIGIASKDSSEVIVKKADIELTFPSKKCLHSYRKKQEFSGGIINVNQLNCHGSKNISQEGSFINRTEL